MPNRKEVFKKIYLLLPIVLIIVLMLTGTPVMHAALYGIFSLYHSRVCINKDIR